MKEERVLLEVIEKQFLKYKTLGEKTFEQLDDRALHFRKNERENSIYVLVRHMRGNMFSRFTDFLTSDGEKSWRNRDGEFEADPDADKTALLKLWNEGWGRLLKTLHTLDDDDLKKEVTIRGEMHLVVDALLRQLSHYAYHVGQIVYIAKQLKGEDWHTLSIPPGQSEQFTESIKHRHAE